MSLEQKNLMMQTRLNERSDKKASLSEKHVKKNENICEVMVCVTRQKTCERLIKYGAQLAEHLGANLLVAHAFNANRAVMDSVDEAEALEQLTRITFEYGGEMSVLRCEDAFVALTDCARQKSSKWMILGSSPQNATFVSERIKTLLPKISVIVLDAEGNEKRKLSVSN